MLKYSKCSKPVRVGFLPTRRTIFSKEAAQREKRKIESKLEKWGISFINLDWLNEEGLLYDSGDVAAVVAHFQAEGVDCVFAPHCNFGTEDAVAKVGRDIGKPFLLWGPRDDPPDKDGMRQRDTQCGLFATSKILRRMKVPFTYIVNCSVEDSVFERAFRNFIAVANVVRCFRRARIGQIDTRPQSFYTVAVNEGELLERWGVELVPVGLVSIIDAAGKALDGNDVTAEAASIKERIDTSAVDDAAIRRIAAFKLELLRFALENKVDALAIQCWTALQECFGISTCLVNAELTELGIPVACETDIHGAMTSVALQAAAMGQKPTFFADLTVRHPTNENGELLWHCGPFPLSLADPDCKPALSDHFAFDNSAGTAQLRMKGGDITLARFDGDHGEYSMYMGHARGIKGPHTMGTYLWVEVDNWPKWEERIVCGPYIHHTIGVHGKFSPVMFEACKYLGIKPDPFGPDEESIRSYLRGQSDILP